MRIEGVGIAAVGFRLGIGEPGARRVGVLHPVEPPCTDHHVRVAIELKERRDRPHAILDVAMKQDPALAGDVVAEQDVEVLHMPSEQGPPTDPTNGNAVRAIVTRVGASNG